MECSNHKGMHELTAFLCFDSCNYGGPHSCSQLGAVMLASRPLTNRLHRPHVSHIWD